MRRSVKSRGARKARSVIQWAEQKVARDAVASAARAVVVGGAPNYAQRGLVLSQGEFKAVDVLTNIAVNIASSVTLLNGMTSGSGINQHVGREVTLRSIQFNYTTMVNAATGVDQLHRILLVYDRQTNASALTAAQVLAAVDPHSPRNLENRKRFKILYDRTHALNASGEPGSFATRRFYRRLRHPVTFNAGVAGTVADIVTGSLYLVAIGSEAAGAPAGFVTFSSRIRYTDN